MAELLQNNTTVLNVVYAADLKRLAAACEKEEIRLTALRGAAWLADDFSAASRRSMLDIDILVEPADAKKTVEIIVRDGWQPLPGGECCFARKDPPRYIDLHTEIRGVPRSSQKEILKHSRPAREIPEITVLCVEDAVLLDAVHAVVDHGYLDSKWLDDAADTIRRAGNPFDWNFLSESAARAGMKIALTVFLEELSGRVEVPPKLLRISGGDYLRRAIVRRVIDRKKPTVDRGHVMRILLAPGPVELVITAGGMLFPGLRFVRRRYGLSSRRAALAHSVLRPFRVLGKLFSLVRRMRPNQA
ncbi:MAG: hypothetical protein E3J72_20450 [Planctomycetota bacterium]|nr:MAG: hypothetical protein E3J72_20450 [Planctomycetota bacterium]